MENPPKFVDTIIIEFLQKKAFLSFRTQPCFSYNVNCVNHEKENTREDFIQQLGTPTQEKVRNIYIPMLHLSATGRLIIYLRTKMDC